MAGGSTSSQVFEGVFAVAKPPALSSAQVIRDLQTHFANSQTFAPLLQRTDEEDARNGKGSRSKRRRIDNDNRLKIGHGGTLDPMATGTLIVGIGRGTKHLQDFLDCKKTYETVVLFGKATDTYDIAGKIVKSVPHSHITRQLVEEKLTKFRGDIEQVPPIYSALKINGMKAYEYARTGKPLPRQLESRKMHVDECTILDWYEEGSHEFRWPAEEATDEDKRIAQAFTEHTSTKSLTNNAAGAKTHDTDGTRTSTNLAVGADNPLEPSESSKDAIDAKRATSPPRKQDEHTHEITNLAKEAATAPAARIRLSVSSGFYVRSFCHDLGIDCGSLACMAELKRTQQGDYIVPGQGVANKTLAITYEDLEKGEEHWGPILQKVLAKWMGENPVQVSNHRDNARSYSNRGRPKHKTGPAPKRRNSSSSEG